MIAHLRGTVAHRDLDSVVVDVGGVGYLVHVPATADVPARGQEVELRTTLVVREDAMTLYGFTDADAQRLFDLLLSASGVGPKLAIAVLSTHRPATVRQAIGAADIDVLVAVPGIGKKSANRLVLELKDKVGAFDVPDVILPDSVGGATDGGAPDAVADTRDALASLGYAPGEISATLARIDRDGDPSTLLRRALQLLGSGA